MKISADKIVELLAVKHASDIFIAECKDGPSMCTGHLRMDAWTMTKSWANACATGYEIKVSRSDFVNDKKWRMYLPLCNCFYFVAPQDIIRPDELPPEAGLIVVSKTGGRLFIKKKAPERDVQIPQTLYQYVLMWRAEIVAEHHQQRNTVDDWRHWLAQKAEDREVGRNVSKTLARTVSERITLVDCENKKLLAQIEEFKQIRTLLERLGIDDEYVRRYSIESQLRAARRVIPNDLHWEIKRSAEALANLLKEVNKLNEAAEVAAVA